MFLIFIVISVFAAVERWRLNWRLTAGRSNHLMGGWFIVSVVSMSAHSVWPMLALTAFAAAQIIAISCLVFAYLQSSG